MKIKKVGVVLNPMRGGLEFEYQKLKKLLGRIGIDSFIEGERSGKEADLWLSIGGDGTFLGMSRKVVEYKKPVLGLHYGHLGFLAQFETGDLKGVVDMISNGTFDVRKRMVLRAEYDNKEFLAINEVVFKSRKSSGIVHLKLYKGEKYINGYFGDGLIVSTPTGSTGYNMSASGPIVYPFLKNFVLTPICPHSLTQRSLVLPGSVRGLKILVQDVEAVMIVDGQEEYNIPIGTIVKIEKSKISLRMVCRNERDFFGVLREKLSWGDHR